MPSLTRASIDQIDPDPKQRDEQNALEARLRDTAAKQRSNPHADERGDEYGDRDQELVETEEMVGGKTKKKRSHAKERDSAHRRGKEIFIDP